MCKMYEACERKVRGRHMRGMYEAHDGGRYMHVMESCEIFMNLYWGGGVFHDMCPPPPTRRGRLHQLHLTGNTGRERGWGDDDEACRGRCDEREDT